MCSRAHSPVIVIPLKRVMKSCTLFTTFLCSKVYVITNLAGNHLKLNVIHILTRLVLEQFLAAGKAATSFRVCGATQSYDTL